VIEQRVTRFECSEDGIASTFANVGARFIRRARIGDAPAAVREPAAGERILEIGPGTGYYTFDVAERLGEGTLEIFDIQQEMLDHVMREAGRRGVTNVTPTLGDAQALPFEDNSIDGAVLVTVLGEIPDQEQALREIARVLRPGGRLVVGELFGDPHMVTTGKLTERASRAGLELEQRLGSPLAFFARLRK